MAGAAILALLMNAPQVKADDIVVFGGEFEDEAPAPKKVTKPEPIRELPPAPQPPPPAQIEQPPVEPVKPPIEEKPVETVQPPAEEKPAEPPPIEQPPVEPAPPVEEKPEIVTPKDKPPTQPLEQPAEPAQPAQVPPQDVSSTLPEEDEDEIGDTLTFDDLKQTPEQKPLEQPQQPPTIEEPTPAPIEQPPTEIEQPFGRPSKISAGEPVAVVPPTPQLPAQSIEPTTPIQEPTPIEKPTPQQKPRRASTPRHSAPPKNLKTLQQRFMKLAVDDTYTYYLDKNSVQWKKMPYSTSEYIADVWIRMVEREPKELDDDMASYGADNFNAEISLAREQGYQYAADDVNVLRSQAYVLEHYYLRPKTRQIQFLCELEVFGRPQNTVSERAYDYKNWENLVPGSVESVIYEATIKIIGEWKSTERGHMTFSDMLDEYLRISL